MVLDLHLNLLLCSQDHLSLSAAHNHLFFSFSLGVEGLVGVAVPEPRHQDQTKELRWSGTT